MLQLRPPIHSAPKMRNHNRPSNDETDRERLEDLGTGDTFLGTASEMIRDAVIAPQHQGRDEAEQLLGPDVERAGFVRAGVECEEPVDNEIPLAEDFSVQSFPEVTELLERSTMLVRSVIAALYRR